MQITRNINTIKNKSINANIYNFKAWINITDSSILSPSLKGLLDNTGYNALQFIEHYFPNGGYTCLWLLAESHLAVHTFIDDNKTYIELSGCNKNMSECFAKKFRLIFKDNIIENNKLTNEV